MTSQLSFLCISFSHSWRSFPLLVFTSAAKCPELLHILSNELLLEYILICLHFSQNVAIRTEQSIQDVAQPEENEK